MPMVLVSSLQERNSMSDYEMLMIVLTIIGLVLISNNQKKNNHPTLAG
jgi:hypothetical protein